MTQLALALPEPVPPVATDGEALFYAGTPDRSGLAVYTHLVRGEDDPAETKARGGGKRAVGWWKKIGEPEEWAARILEHLSDGQPRTANRIAVELTGTTIDVHFDGALDRGLWLLVEREQVAWSATVPVLFVDVRATVYETQAGDE